MTPFRLNENAVTFMLIQMPLYVGLIGLMLFSYGWVLRIGIIPAVLLALAGCNRAYYYITHDDPSWFMDFAFYALPLIIGSINLVIRSILSRKTRGLPQNSSQQQ